MTLFEPMTPASVNGDECGVCLYFLHFGVSRVPDPGRKIGKELASAKLAIASTIEGIRNLQSSQNSMLTTQR
jgi:hypothetical protein